VGLWWGCGGVVEAAMFASCSCIGHHAFQQPLSEERAMDAVTSRGNAARALSTVNIGVESGTEHNLAGGWR
jgi:hypothetical protein